MAVPVALVLLAVAFVAMDGADDGTTRFSDREWGAADLDSTDHPTTTALGAEPAGAGGTGPSTSGRAPGTRVSAGRATPPGAGPTPTTQPGSSTGGPTPTTQPGGSSPPPSESDPPDLSGLRAGELPDGEDQIFEDAGCGSTTISVEALATDESGIRSATLYWSFGGASGTVTGATLMSHSGGVARATFGPFPPGTAPAGGVLITWFVEATDGAGNTARAYAPSSPIDERISLTRCT